MHCVLVQAAGNSKNRAFKSFKPFNRHAPFKSFGIE
jgi:hypothetical protein